MRRFVASPPGVVVLGGGSVSDALEDGLRRAGRRVERLDDLNGSAAALARAGILLLTSSRLEDASVFDELAAPCSERPRRLPPLRVILAHRAGVQPLIPPSHDQRGMRVDHLDLQAGYARYFFVRWPLHAGMDPGFGQVPHLLFAGDAAPSTALAVHAIRLAHYGERQAVFTFACEDPPARRRSLLGDYPEAGRPCRLQFTGLGSPSLDDQPPVTSVFVCQGSAEEGLATAGRLAHWIARTQGVSPVIHLEVGDAQPAGDVSEWDGQIVPFSWLREACRPELWLDGQGDELARVVHDHYRDSIAAQGRDPDVEAAGNPWENLDTSYRDANRHQADHLWAKLAATDCRAVPEDQVESFAFAPLEVERLAVIEHARWAADRFLDGWTYAPVRDNARKHHPQLVPYDDLSEPMKDLDRFAVRLAPVLLARSGRGVVRMLIVGLPDAALDEQVGASLSRRCGLVLHRLRRRYPDRSLVLASTLGDSAVRLVVRRALEDFEAGLFFLCPGPVRDMIGAQPTDRARRDLLDLAVRAERRVCLGPDVSPESWFAARAEILFRLGAGQSLARPAKQVVLEPERLDPVWNFDY
jgi:hypothetical protein